MNLCVFSKRFPVCPPPRAAAGGAAAEGGPGLHVAVPAAGGAGGDGVAARRGRGALPTPAAHTACPASLPCLLVHLHSYRVMHNYRVNVAGSVRHCSKGASCPTALFCCPSSLSKSFFSPTLSFPCFTSSIRSAQQARGVSSGDINRCHITITIAIHTGGEEMIPSRSCKLANYMHTHAHMGPTSLPEDPGKLVGKHGCIVSCALLFEPCICLPESAVAFDAYGEESGRSTRVSNPFLRNVSCGTADLCPILFSPIPRAQFAIQIGRGSVCPSSQ